MHVLAAPDKFRGTASAIAVAEAIASAAQDAGASCDQIPMADGGEGTLDAFGGPNRTTVVTNPLGDPVEAGWRLEGTTAYIESARASGISLVGGAEGNDAMSASTYGTGELIGAALDLGARRVLVAVGGSATTDGGFGALRALYPTQRLRGVEIVVACDVRTGFTGAAEVFAPQKGASTAEVQLLKRRLERLAGDYREQYDVDVTTLVGAGAAGGLAGGLAAVGAELASGFELVAEELRLYERTQVADLVVTGEGFLDEESFDGKVVGGVVSYAETLDVPVLVLAGERLQGVGGALDVVSLVERFGADRARSDVTGCAREVLAELWGA